MSDKEGTVKREDKHAAIYFEPGASREMKDLANKIRAEGGRTTLVWANRWKGPESILTEAKAVVVQKGCSNEQKIVDAYRKFSHDVEIHYVDQDGAFADPGATYAEEPADAIVQESEDHRGSEADASDDTEADGDSDDESEDDASSEDGDDEDADQGGSEESKLED